MQLGGGCGERRVVEPRCVPEADAWTVQVGHGHGPPPHRRIVPHEQTGPAAPEFASLGYGRIVSQTILWRHDEIGNHLIEQAGLRHGADQQQPPAERQLQLMLR